jgi:phosphoribosylanthranilate isomerase
VAEMGLNVKEDSNEMNVINNRKKAKASHSLEIESEGSKERTSAEKKKVAIKICGLTRPSDIDMVNVGKPEYIGFVFAKSRRMVTPLQATGLRKRLIPGIIPVGVFVDEPIEKVLALVRDDVIQMVQLHGKEDEEYIKRLKERTDRPIIKAISVRRVGDIQERASTIADYLLLDSPGGGTGSTFDWSLIPDIIQDKKGVKPYFLAGGLNVDNIRTAISQTRVLDADSVNSAISRTSVLHADCIRTTISLAGTFAVDVSSGVETDGFKDSKKINEFIRRARDE